MVFVPKSEQQVKQTPPARPKSPEEVLATVAQIRSMCDQVERELFGGDLQSLNTGETKPVPMSLRLCPKEVRKLIDDNMADDLPLPERQDVHVQSYASDEPAEPSEQVVSIPSVYDQLFS